MRTNVLLFMLLFVGIQVCRGQSIKDRVFLDTIDHIIQKEMNNMSNDLARRNKYINKNHIKVIPYFVLDTTYFPKSFDWILSLRLDEVFCDYYLYDNNILGSVVSRIGENNFGISYISEQDTLLWDKNIILNSDYAFKIRLLDYLNDHVLCCIKDNEFSFYLSTNQVFYSIDDVIAYKFDSWSNFQMFRNNSLVFYSWYGKKHNIDYLMNPPKIEKNLLKRKIKILKYRIRRLLL